jgi:transcriptional regulator with XRE-family HTH domain
LSIREAEKLSARELGRRVCAARAYAGLSQPELAEQLRFGRTTIWQIEHGHRYPKPGELLHIARICGVADDFFERDAL